MTARDIYGNLANPPDGDGFEAEDFDAESLTSFLLGYDEDL